MAFDFELTALRQILGTSFEFEIVGAYSQRQRGFAVDVEMAAEFRRSGHVQFDRPFNGRSCATASSSIEMHPRGDGLAGGAINHFDSQLAVGMRGRRIGVGGL